MNFQVGEGVNGGHWDQRPSCKGSRLVSKETRNQSLHPLRVSRGNSLTAAPTEPKTPDRTGSWNRLEAGTGSASAATGPLSRRRGAETPEPRTQAPDPGCAACLLADGRSHTSAGRSEPHWCWRLRTRGSEPFPAPRTVCKLWTRGANRRAWLLHAQRGGGPGLDRPLGRGGTRGSCRGHGST